MNRALVAIIGSILVVGTYVYLKPPKSSPPPQSVNETASVQDSTKTNTDALSVVASGLDTPWGLAFLPDKSILVTERAGRIRLINPDGSLAKEPVATLTSVKEIGEGGLLGITPAPGFIRNNLVYLYYTYSESGGNTLNRVVRMTYLNGALSNEQVIVDKIPGASNHNGGRIKFSPDGYLYITTGDAQEPSLAQDIRSMAGKILKVDVEGKAPAGSTFNSLVYSYGHRNPQGLAWDDQNRLWATEHGRSGVQSGLDEVNLVEKGKNYGWPIVEGDKTGPGFIPPRLHSKSDTWAPAGMAFYKDALYFGGLRGQALYKTKVVGDNLSLTEHFKGELGRIRDVVLGPDEMLYITTSNLDGRGSPKDGDDKIIKINLNSL